MLYKMVNSIVAIDFFNKRVPVIESDLYSAKLRTEINQTMEQLAGDPGSSTSLETFKKGVAVYYQCPLNT